MPDNPKKGSFQTAQPKIPGVPQRASLKKEEQPKQEPSQTVYEEAAKKRADVFRMPYVWAGGGGAILALIIALIWWVSGASHEPVAEIEASRSVTNAAAARPASAAPVAPGPIATASEMKRLWSTKDFIYKESNGQTIPALLVHLPGDAYWAILLREPYESCELELVSAEKLRSDYDLSSSYPMVADPCTHAVFDLTQYGSGPNGLVRGAIVSGTAVRPPLAVEVEIKGGKIIASREEKLTPSD